MPAQPRQLGAISLRPNEIVVGRVVVTVDASRAFDPDIARKGLDVAGVDGTVRFRAGGRRALWEPREPLPAGRYRFVVGELASRAGTRLVDGGDISFAVVHSRAKVPSLTAVESMVRLRVGQGSATRLPLFEAPTGRYLEVIKGIDRRTSVPVSLALDQSGRRLDADRVLAGLEVARAKAFGRMHETLFRARHAADDDCTPNPSSVQRVCGSTQRAWPFHDSADTSTPVIAGAVTSLD